MLHCLHCKPRILPEGQEISFADQPEDVLSPEQEFLWELLGPPWGKKRSVRTLFFVQVGSRSVWLAQLSAKKRHFADFCIWLQLWHFCLYGRPGSKASKRSGAPDTSPGIIGGEKTFPACTFSKFTVHCTIHIISYHIISYHIISYHIISYPQVRIHHTPSPSPCTLAICILCVQCDSSFHFQNQPEESKFVLCCSGDNVHV